jgi:hypothetical protein
MPCYSLWGHHGDDPGMSLSIIHGFSPSCSWTKWGPCSLMKAGAIMELSECTVCCCPPCRKQYEQVYTAEGI